MTPFDSVLLGVWREACRHIELHESTASIARMLTRYLPIQRIIVREIDIGRSCLETVAARLHARPATPYDGRTDLAPGEMKKLLVWSERQELTAVGWPPSGLDPLRKLVPSSVEADILAGPAPREAGGPDRRPPLAGAARRTLRAASSTDGPGPARAPHATRSHAEAGHRLASIPDREGALRSGPADAAG